MAAAVVGNWLEFYDFVVYTYFAIQIGDAFFPPATPFERLMFSLITFGVGFVFRPIGAVVFGLFADRVGRRPAMLASFFMMGLALTGFVLMPSYQQIGMAAPVLAVICRLVQGFALGGEIGPNTAFLIEVAPLGKRGLYGAWQSASQSIASITAGGGGARRRASAQRRGHARVGLARRARHRRAGAAVRPDHAPARCRRRCTMPSRSWTCIRTTRRTPACWRCWPATGGSS